MRSPVAASSVASAGSSGSPRARAKSLAVPTGTTPSGARALAGGLGRAADRAVAAGDDHPLRGGRGDVVGAVELEAGDLESAGAQPPLDARPPRPTRSPGWPAGRSRAAQVGIFERPSRPFEALLFVALREVSNGFSARSPALPGSFPAASWPAPRVLSTPFCGHHEARGSRNARIARMMQTATDYGDGQAGSLPWLPVHSCAYPAAPGRKPGRIRARGRGGAARRLRAPVPARRIADVRRGLLGVHRRLHPRGAGARADLRRRAARRRPARLDVVAEPARHRRRGGLRRARRSPS